MNIPFSTYPIWEGHIILQFIKEKEKEVRSIIVRYIHKSQQRYPYWIPPLNIRIIFIYLYMIIIPITTMIDINIAEIFITTLLDILEYKVRNTCIIRIYPSLTYF